MLFVNIGWNILNSWPYVSFITTYPEMQNDVFALMELWVCFHVSSSWYKPLKLTICFSKQQICWEKPCTIYYVFMCVEACLYDLFIMYINTFSSDGCDGVFYLL